MTPPDTLLPPSDPVFLRALELSDAGQVDDLTQLLVEHPQLVLAHTEYAESGYFARPALLWFVAQNPIRQGHMPENVVEVAKAVVEAGTAPADVTMTLALVASGCVARQAHRQVPLLEYLVSAGGDPTNALDAAVGQRERESAQTLLRLGAVPSLAAAAGLGDLMRLQELMQSGLPESEAAAMAMHNAVVNNQPAAVATLLDSGVCDVNAFIAPGATPLHQAANFGFRELAELLVKRGADARLRDTRWNGTPAGWAREGGHDELAKWLDECAEHSGT